MTQNQLLAWPGLKKKLPLLAAALPFVAYGDATDVRLAADASSAATDTADGASAVAVGGGGDDVSAVLSAERMKVDVLLSTGAVAVAGFAMYGSLIGILVWHAATSWCVLQAYARVTGRSPSRA